MGRDDTPSPLQTVDRALQILCLFSPTTPELTVTQVARELDVSRSIASRLLSALEVRQFVSQDAQTGRFRVGVRNLDLGALFVQSHRLVTAATPYLEQLSGKSDEPAIRANLFILDGGQALRLASYPARPLTRLRVPAHATAAGKVLLANLAEPALRRVLDEWGMPALTDHTITDATILRERLDEVRRRGYASDAEEIEAGSYCYAAPIKDVSGRTVGAVSASVTAAARPSPAFAVPVIDAVCDVGRRISEGLGSGFLWPAPATGGDGVRDVVPTREPVTASASVVAG